MESAPSDFDTVALFNDIQNVSGMYFTIQNYFVISFSYPTYAKYMTYMFGVYPTKSQT